MRKYLTAVVLCLALVSMGCAGAQKQDMSKDTAIKCPKCGVEFPAHEGMEH